MDGRIEDSTTEVNGHKALKVSILPNSRILNLSTDLMGASFSLRDFTYQHKNNGDLPWDGYEVDICSFVKDIDFVQTDGPVFAAGWCIAVLENFSIPYRRNFKNHDDFISFHRKGQSPLSKEKIGQLLKKYEELPCNVNKQRETDALGRMRINHDPRMLDYWHFTIDLYPEENPEVALDSNKGSWKKKFVSLAGDYLRRTFTIYQNEEDVPPLYSWREICMPNHLLSSH